VVEVIVEGQPEFDFSKVSVTLDGTRDDGTAESRSLANRAGSVWTETGISPGQYTVRAVVTGPEQMSGEAQVAVRGGQTAQAQITLRPGVVVAKAFIVHFRFDSAFVEPCMLRVLERLFGYAQSHPSEKILVVGHTDLVGDGTYNQALSERRARSVFALLTFGTSDALRAGAITDWDQLRRQKTTGLNDAWGVREYQYLLQHLQYYSGNIDEQHGPKTDAAVRAFQQDNSLPITGLVDDPTWQKLVEAYLGAGALALPKERFMPNAKNGCDGGILKWLGCGEQDPVRNTQDAWRPNRRTEILFVQADRLPCDVPEPITFKLPAPGAVSSSWCLGPGDPNQRACFTTRSAEGPDKWLVRPAEPEKINITGTILFDDGTPYAKKKFVLIAPDGEFLHTDTQGNTDLGENPSSGRPIPSRTDADGNFNYPKQTPIGIYTLELLSLNDPEVARANPEPPDEAIGNVVCLAVEAV
jgi:outer membrane protein OmpA-like peptidoglycan-associated protein